MGDRIMPPPRGPVNPRKKFGVKPGFSMLDWNLLKGRAKNLAGKDEVGMRGITKAEVRKHNAKHDCWSIFRGKVYNLTPFLHYHPGGIPEIMKGAGRDCTALYDKYHPWVNFESLVGNLYLGPLVTEEELEAARGAGSKEGADDKAADKTSDAKDTASGEKRRGEGKEEGTEEGKEKDGEGGDGAVDRAQVDLEKLSATGKQELDRAESANTL